MVPLKTPDDLATSLHLTPDFFAVTPVVVCIARISYLGPDTCDQTSDYQYPCRVTALTSHDPPRDEKMEMEKEEEEESDRSVDSCVITLVLLAGGVPSRLRVSY